MRTKGAVSNVVVKLSDLQKVFKPDAPLISNKRFCDAHGIPYEINGTQVTQTAVNNAKAKSKANNKAKKKAEKVEMTVNEA